MNSNASATSLWCQLPGRILAVVDRLKDAEVRCRSALELIDYYNRPDVFVYCDQPYPLSMRTYNLYEHEMTDEEHLCSAPHYNLGAWKLHDWLRDQDYNETGLKMVRGLDQRFDKQRGAYKMTFASRGCPVNCSFCIVPRLEGLTFILDPDFIPAPVLCDNNLSALEPAFQQHIIDRYLAFNQPLLDANSGFEPHTFHEDTYSRWKPVLRGPWRFALDEMRELEDARRMMEILKDVPASRKGSC